MISQQDVKDHFAARAATYNRSSSWCVDDELNSIIVRTSAVGAGGTVLDVACGTGLVSRAFRGVAARVVGLDITDEMSAQARPFLDELVVSPAETMPFADATYDAVVCRQGIQFMDLPAAVEEMARVTRPGGRIVLTNLCAYGPDDRAEYFEILRLRNPVRRHFFEQADVEELMRGAGLTDVVSEQHITVEDVDVWSDNGAIDEGRREAIRAVYRAASPEFSSRHAQQLVDGRIVDNMLMVVTSGQVG